MISTDLGAPGSSVPSCANGDAALASVRRGDDTDALRASASHITARICPR